MGSLQDDDAMMTSCYGHGWLAAMFGSFLLTREWLRAQKVHHLTVFILTLLGYPACSDYIPHGAEIANLCARIPHETNSARTPTDGGFQVKIDDDPHMQHYAPEHVYRISISGRSSVEHMILGAYLVAVPYNSSDESVTVGNFHLVDGGQLAFHVGCTHIVTTVDSLPKAEVYVMWKSPLHEAGCVEFRYIICSCVIVEIHQLLIQTCDLFFLLKSLFISSVSLIFML